MTRAPFSHAFPVAYEMFHPPGLTRRRTRAPYVTNNSISTRSIPPPVLSRRAPVSHTSHVRRAEHMFMPCR